jgi:tRNA(fMet)-specific endonuclease VapC
MPPLYLLDTNILVHLVRGDGVGQYVRDAYAPLLRDPRPLICVVSDGELRSLALQWGWGAKKNDQMRFLLGFFGRVPVEHQDVLAAYATLDAWCLAQGVRIGQNDVWIAAAAYATGARLITTDKDFDALQPAFITREWVDPSNTPAA